jgi:hypothetical protein
MARLRIAHNIALGNSAIALAEYIVSERCQLSEAIGVANNVAGAGIFHCIASNDAVLYFNRS